MIFLLVTLIIITVLSLKLNGSAVQTEISTATMLCAVFLLCYSVLSSFYWLGESSSESDKYSHLSVSMEEFRRQNLELHNKYRNLHGVHELSYTDELNREAERHAEDLAQKESDVLLFSQSADYGENLLLLKRDMKIDGNFAVYHWYIEGSLYNYNKEPGNFSKVERFAQIVSRRSCFMGIGTAKSKLGRKYVVAKYYPEGKSKKAQMFSPYPVFPPGGVEKSKITPYEYLVINLGCADADRETYLKQNLECHNVLRKMHGVPPLAYKDTMNEFAYAYAMNEMSNESSHIEWKSYNTFSVVFPSKFKIGYEYCRRSFNEGSQYSLNVFSSLDEVSEELNPATSFTQMIWKSTKYIGFAMVRGKNNKIYSVVAYDPPGNLKGHYKHNIFPQQLEENSSQPTTKFMSTIFNVPFIILFILTICSIIYIICLNYYYNILKTYCTRPFREGIELANMNCEVYKENK